MSTTICYYCLLPLIIFAIYFNKSILCFPNNLPSNKNPRPAFETTKTTDTKTLMNNRIVLENSSARKSDNFRRHYPSSLMADNKNNTRGIASGDFYNWSSRRSRRPPLLPKVANDDDHLPVLGLLENPDAKYDPANPNDLDESMLRRLLGADFDPDYSSTAVATATSDAVAMQYPFETNGKKPIRLHIKGGQRIPREFRNLFKHSELPNGARVKLHLKSQFKRRVYDYLWAYSYCPVQYAWKDLGVRFWPRWIKEGRCHGNGAGGERSCSIPPGMTCKPSSSKHVIVLRWHCRNWHTASYCSWIKIHYPILTSCTCSC